MRSKAKMKLSLLASMGVSLLAVASASISTFAWFQAQADVTITASGASTTITVTKPDDYSFFAYKGNKLSSWTPNNTFENDFIEITSAEILAQQTDLSGIYPGQKFTYAVKIENKTSANLKITKIKSNDTSMESISRARVVWQQTSTYINIGWAMNIYSTSVAATTPSYAQYSGFVSNPASGNEDMFKYDEFDTTQDEDENYIYRRAYYLEGTTSSNVVALKRPISIFSSSSLSGTTYIFYSVVFSNEDTTYFKEMDGGSGTAEEIDIPKPTGTRYFKKVTYGNSNCYSGLTFALTELKLEI